MEKLEHPSNKLAHYAKACTDITFRFPFGQQELMGIAARGDYDLKQHSIHTKKEMTYLDSATNNKFLPHVIEPSLGKKIHFYLSILFFIKLLIYFRYRSFISFTYC